MIPGGCYLVIGKYTNWYNVSTSVCCKKKGRGLLPVINSAINMRMVTFGCQLGANEKSPVWGRGGVKIALPHLKVSCLFTGEYCQWVYIIM